MYEALLDFLPAHAGPCRILVLNGGDLDLLQALLRGLPQAEVTAAGKPSLQSARLRWQLGELSFPEGSFHYIAAPRIFEREAEPEAFARKLRSWLRPDGRLLTCFGNIRHWSVLQELMAGHFRYDSSVVRMPGILHFFALPEIVRFFEKTHYRELSFLPELREAAPELKERLLHAGFANVQEDLDTELWFVQAGRSTEAAGYLKCHFSPELRQELVYLLRRIEQDIAVEENAQTILRLCRENGVSMDYLARLAVNALAAPKSTLQKLAGYLEDAHENG